MKAENDLDHDKTLWDQWRLRSVSASAQSDQSLLIVPSTVLGLSKEG